MHRGWPWVLPLSAWMLTAACVVPNLEAENKTCSEDAPCPSAYACVPFADGGVCQLSVSVEDVCGSAATRCPPPAPALTFSAALGDAGSWGLPYGWLGPRGTLVWEEYRKDLDTHAPPYGPATVIDAGPDGFVLYGNVRQGFDPADNPSFAAPGVFFSQVRARASPASAGFVFSRTQASGYDIRLVFAENGGADGGAPLNAFVANAGGDDGEYTDFVEGDWGVNGLYVNFHLDSTQSTWRLCGRVANLVAAASRLNESDGTSSTRVNHWTPSEMTVNATPLALDGGSPCEYAVPPFWAYDLGSPADQPLAVSWDIVHGDGGVGLEAQFGAGASLSWTFDDGVARHGLSDPGNPDGVGYQGGGLDVTSLVPAVFACSILEGIENDLPPLQLDIGIAGAVPTVQGLLPTADTSSPSRFVVAALDSAGAQVTGYGQTVEFFSSDPNATLPPPYTFTAGDMGAHVFAVSFGTSGAQSVTVREVDTPALSSEQGTQVSVAQAASCAAAGSFSHLWALATLCAIFCLRRREHL